MKQKLKSINSKLDTNIKKILCQHQDKKKSISPEEYLSEHNANMSDRHQQIKQNYNQITKNLKEIGDVIKVNKASKEWEKYRYFINDIIIQGQINAIESFLKKLLIRIEYIPQKIFDHQIFEIHMKLANRMIVYDPPIEVTHLQECSVRNSVLGWMNDCYHIGTLF